MTSSILHMTTELVLTQILTGAVTPATLKDVLRTTYHTLQMLNLEEQQGLPPAVSSASGIPNFDDKVDWKQSITQFSVTCLECGKTFKQLSRLHLRTHGLDRSAYRAKYGIPGTQALVARATSARRRAVVQQVRPWEKAHPGRRKLGSDHGS